MKLTPVIIETPYAGDVLRNVAYARLCAHHCLIEHHEAPFASHLLYTQDGILDDGILVERELGIEAGLVWGKFARKTVVYTDLGISGGMQRGITRALAEGRFVEHRTITGWRDKVAARMAKSIEQQLAAKIAEVNTQGIELQLAKKRHADLAQMWQVLDVPQRWELFDRIFEKGQAA